jgi:hypothetical protein
MRLRGMTGDHPRGDDPLVAIAGFWREQHGADIVWDRRSDFECYPKETLARRYDLMVIDHPHIGEPEAGASNLYADAQPTLDGSWLRPRHKWVYGLSTGGFLSFERRSVGGRKR